MKTNWIFVLLMALVLGCGGAPEDTDTPATPPAEGDGASVEGDATTLVSVAKYCGECGEAKDSESCCAEGAEKCDCSFAKGSALCCKVTKDAEGKDFCGSCGQVADSESCCAEGAEKCDCGMVKGSPLCCMDAETKEAATE